VRNATLNSPMFGLSLFLLHTRPLPGATVKKKVTVP
jgi:hypothetical protein